MAILSLVGKQMKNMIGIAGKMFSTLGENNVNIEMISQGKQRTCPTEKVTCADLILQAQVRSTYHALLRKETPTEPSTSCIQTCLLSSRVERSACIRRD
jgi:hypothetical protein